ncbi:hypothetical protein HDU77_004685 [Chytriomyces hyalinus]|nr:hypothetical protein HDU77_004685 [Chytriomyces hyalinus]
MGGLLSTPEGLPTPAAFCEPEQKLVNKCMSDLNYDREKYKIACRDLFVSYRDCRQRWKDLKVEMQKAELGMLRTESGGPESNDSGQKPK